MPARSPIGAFFADVKRGLLQLLLPNTCWACAAPLPERDRSFCAPCEWALRTDPFFACPRCGSTVGPHVPLEGGCIHCRDESFAFDAVVRVGTHDGLLRDMVLRLKQPGGDTLAEAVAGLLAEDLARKLAPLRPDCLVPVPLHWLRTFQRGFNQSAIIAGRVASVLGKPCRPRLLRRVRRTLPQTSQTGAQRRDNVRGAFLARPAADLAGKTLVLVDDVMTTGSTAHEAARALKALKPARIAVCVLARR
ncbi:MAG: ComF family protein [Gemmataceae bacterium]